MIQEANFFPEMDSREMPFTRSDGEQPHNPLAKTYVWASCKTPGWQALLPSSMCESQIPEPPNWVLSRENKSASKSPRRREVALVTPAVSAPSDRIQLLEEEERAPPTPTDANVLKPRPSRNFILDNIKDTSPSRRKARNSILDEATKQLRESELIGASLAGRLNLIQKRLIDDEYPRPIR
jgi:hypothetical protein